MKKKIKSSWCVSHGPPSGNPNQPLESLEPEVLPYPPPTGCLEAFPSPGPPAARWSSVSCQHAQAVYCQSPVRVPMSPAPCESSSTSLCGDIPSSTLPVGWGEAARGKFVQQMFMAGFGDWGDWTRSLKVLPQRMVRWGGMGRGYQNGS